MSSSLLDQIDAYFDAAPRTGADAVDVGPFTMFLRRGPWGYYARPRMQRDRDQRFTVSEVDAVLDVQRQRGEHESFEWVHDLDPSLADATRHAGLTVTLRPLLCLETSIADGGQEPIPRYRTELLEPEHSLLALHRAVADVSFAHGGTNIGESGITERDAITHDEEAIVWMAKRLKLGHTLPVAAFDRHDQMVGVGCVQPVVDPVLDICAAELVGIAVLPKYRRQGIAIEITRALICLCLEREIRTVLLTATDDDVARIYERVGFRRVGTFAEAARPD